jgi:hypothetical protein
LTKNRVLSSSRFREQFFRALQKHIKKSIKNASQFLTCIIFKKIWKKNYFLTKKNEILWKKKVKKKKFNKKKFKNEKKKFLKKKKI